MLRLIRKFSVTSIVPLLWTLVTIILLCIPGSDLPSGGFLVELDNFDKLIHLILFGGIVVLWGSWWHHRTADDREWFKAICAVTLGVVVLGIAMEYVQLYFVANRDFDKADISADIAGAIAAFGYLIMVRKQ